MTASPVIAPLLKYASRLRFPWLLAITAALFVLDLAIPDFVPFADEAILGLLTVLLASLRRRDKTPKESRAPVNESRDA